MSTDAPMVYEQLTKVMAELGYIPKQGSSGVSYEFRSIDALMNHLHGPLAEHGLFLAPRVLDDWRSEQIPGTKDRMQTQVTFRVCVDVYASDGSSVTLGPGLAQAQDYGDKAAYQAQQNAVKYLLLEAFCIPTAEQDMDARQPDAVPQQPFHDSVREALKGTDLSGDELAAGLSAWTKRDVSKVDDLTDGEAQKVANKLKTRKSRDGFVEFARQQAAPEPELGVLSEGFVHAVSSSSVDEVKANVADGLWEAKDVLDVEESGEGRSTLVEWLYERLS